MIYNKKALPEDWILGDLIDFCIKSNRAIVDGPFGSNLKTEHFKKQGIPVINSSFVTELTFNAGNYVYVDEELFQREIRSKVVPGDIVMAKIGARCGSSAILPQNHPISILSGNSIKISIDENENSKEFVWCLLVNEYLKNQFKDCKSIGAQPAISTPHLKKLKFPKPPLPEQRAIAQVLSTADAAIHTTEKLIAQKELRKKWLMQQLLMGKKRMRGVEGEWKKLGAGDVFTSVTKKGFADEELLSATQDRGMIPRTMLEGRVTMPTTGTEGFKLVEVGDFVISLRSFQGGLEYSYYRGLVSPAYTVLKPKKPINEEFYKQYFKSTDFIGHLAIAVIGIRDGKQISYDDFCTVKIPYPPIQEQTAIARVLQVADKEISLLKAKAEKLRELKKGLMQVLLTGKKRLEFQK
ncbi:MAG: restriction endonuclease subunit S [Bacteroidales bacterium]|nr:restriction endonuclease subunit S [Bacteroidales bacterium]